jgi:hypothetical protein
VTTWGELWRRWFPPDLTEQERLAITAAVRCQTDEPISGISKHPKTGIVYAGTITEQEQVTSTRTYACGVMWKVTCRDGQWTAEKAGCWET